MAEVDTTGTVQGALQTLMQNLSQRYDPAENQRQIQARNDLYSEYEQQMRNRPQMPSAFDLGIRGWLAAGPGSANLVRGWAKGQQAFDEQELAEQEAKLKGLEKMANLRNAAIKEDDAMLRANLGLLKGTVGGLKPTVKMDKDGNMVVFNPATNESSVVHSSQRGEYERLYQTFYKAAIDQGMENPEGYAHNNTLLVLKNAPGYNPQNPDTSKRTGLITPNLPTTDGVQKSVAPEVVSSSKSNYVGNAPSTPKDFPQVTGRQQTERDADRAVILKQEWDDAQNIINRYGLDSPQGQAALRNQAEIKRELNFKKDQVKSEPVVTAPIQPNASTPTIKYKDKPAEAGRTEELKTVAEGYGKQYNTILKGADSARNTINLLDNIESNLAGYTTGRLTPATTEIAAWMKPLGVDIDKNLSNKEAFKKSVGQLTLSLKNAGGENNMPGSLSDSDRQFLQDMAPTLADTPEGNRMIIQYHRKVAQRQMEMAKQAEDYFEQYGTFKGFRKQWDEYAKANPLFDKQSGQQGPKRIKITPEMLQGGR